MNIGGELLLALVGAGLVAGPVAAVWAGCYLIGRCVGRWRA